MNGSSGWLIKSFVISGIFALAVLMASLFSMKRAFDAKSQKNKIKQYYNLIPIGCVAIVLLSWILNFGFLRLKLTVQSVPLIHALIFIMINLYAAKKADNSKNLRRILSVMYITYVTSYLLMPDVSEGGMVYVLFGLLKNSEVIIKICNSIYPALFTANVIFMAAAGVLGVCTKEK